MKNEIFSDYEGKGMPTPQERFKQVTGKEFDPDKYEFLYRGADNDFAADDPYVPYTVVEKIKDKSDDSEYLKKLDEINKKIEEKEKERLEAFEEYEKAREEELEARFDYGTITGRKPRASQEEFDRANDRVSDCIEKVKAVSSRLSQILIDLEKLEKESDGLIASLKSQKRNEQEPADLESYLSRLGITADLTMDEALEKFEEANEKNIIDNDLENKLIKMADSKFHFSAKSVIENLTEKNNELLEFRKQVLDRRNFLLSVDSAKVENIEGFNEDIRQIDRQIEENNKEIERNRKILNGDYAENEKENTNEKENETINNQRTVIPINEGIGTDDYDFIETPDGTLGFYDYDFEDTKVDSNNKNKEDVNNESNVVDISQIIQNQQQDNKDIELLTDRNRNLSDEEAISRFLEEDGYRQHYSLGTGTDGGYYPSRVSGGNTLSILDNKNNGYVPGYDIGNRNKNRNRNENNIIDISFLDDNNVDNKLSDNGDNKTNDNGNNQLLPIISNNGTSIPKNDELGKAIDKYMDRVNKNDLPKRNQKKGIIKRVLSRFNIIPLIVTAATLVVSALGFKTSADEIAKKQTNLIEKTSASYSISTEDQEENIYETPEEAVARALGEIKTGDKVEMKKGVPYHHSSDYEYVENDINGKFGSEIRNAGKYTLEYVSIVDPSTGFIRDVEYEKGKNVEEFINESCKEIGKNREDLKIKVHIGGPQTGWIDYNDYVSCVKDGKIDPQVVSTKVVPGQQINGVQEDFDSLVTFTDENGMKATVNLKNADGSYCSVGDQVVASNGQTYKIDTLDIKTDTIKEVVKDTFAAPTSKKNLTFSLSNISLAEGLAAAAISLIGIPATYLYYKRKDDAYSEEEATKSEFLDATRMDYPPYRRRSDGSYSKSWWEGLTHNKETLTFVPDEEANVAENAHGRRR